MSLGSEPILRLWSRPRQPEMLIWVNDLGDPRWQYRHRVCDEVLANFQCHDRIFCHRLSLERANWNDIILIRVFCLFDFYLQIPSPRATLPVPGHGFRGRPSRRPQLTGTVRTGRRRHRRDTPEDPPASPTSTISTGWDCTKTTWKLDTMPVISCSACHHVAPVALRRYRCLFRRERSSTTVSSTNKPQNLHLLATYLGHQSAKVKDQSREEKWSNLKNPHCPLAENVISCPFGTMSIHPEKKNRFKHPVKM